jgi:hypothetical protein
MDAVKMASQERAIQLKRIVQIDVNVIQLDRIVNCVTPQLASVRVDKALLVNIATLAHSDIGVLKRYWIVNKVDVFVNILF